MFQFGFIPYLSYKQVENRIFAKIQPQGFRPRYCKKFCVLPIALYDVWQLGLLLMIILTFNTCLPGEDKPGIQLSGAVIHVVWF